MSARRTVALYIRHPYIQLRVWIPHARVVSALYHMVAQYYRQVLNRVRLPARKRAATEEERRWI